MDIKELESRNKQQARIIDELRKGLQRQTRDAERYRYLRERDLDTMRRGGVFAGMTPRNVVLNGEDLDIAVDDAMRSNGQPACGRSHRCGGSAA